MDYRTLIDEKVDFSRFGAKAKKEDYDLIVNAGINTDKLCVEAFHEVAEQLRRAKTISNITPKTPIVERNNRPIIGEGAINEEKSDERRWSMHEGMSMRKKIYNAIQEHPEGMTYEDVKMLGICAPTGIHKLIVGLVERGLVKRDLNAYPIRLYAKDPTIRFTSEGNETQNQLNDMFPTGTKTEVMR